MSYSDYTCWTTFTSKQKQRMLDFIENTTILQHVIIPYIFGSDLIPCSGNVVYSIPPGATNINWTVTGLTKISTNWNEVTVSKTSGNTDPTGYVSVSGTFCGQNFTVFRIIDIGVPSVKSLEVSPGNSFPQCTSATFTAYPTSITTSQGNYEWMLSPSYGYYEYPNRHSNYVSFQDPGFYAVSVRSYAKTSEGHTCTITRTSWSLFIYVNVSQYSPSPSPAYPNPVGDILNIVLYENSSSNEQSLQSRGAPSSYDVRLYDGQGNLQRQQQTNGGAVQFNVSNLPDGVYYLHIYDGVSSTPEMQAIMVEH